MNHLLYNLKTSLYAAVAICFLMWLIFITGLYQYPLARTFFSFAREIGIAGMIVMACVIFISNSRCKRQLSWKKALQNGLLITLIVAVIGALFLYVYIAYLHPGYPSFILKYRLQFAKTPEDVAFIKETNFRKFIPSHLMYSGFMGLLFQGTILTFLMAVVCKSYQNKKPAPASFFNVH